MPLSDQLVDFWPFDEGAGTTAHGKKGAVALTLERTKPSSSGSVSGQRPAASGWTSESGGRTCYNGGGWADITSLNLLAALGTGLTVAVRLWPGAGSIQGSDWPYDYYQCFGFGGNYRSDGSDYTGFRFGCDLDITSPYNPSALSIQGVTGLPTDFPSGWNLSHGAPNYTPRLLVVTIERLLVSGTPTWRFKAYQDGTQLGSQYDFTSGAWIDATRFMAGCCCWSSAGVSQAALWSRVLSGAEISGLGSDLDDVDAELDSGGEGLLNNDGSHAVSYNLPITRVDLIDVLATDGPQRHARRPHERRRPTYRVPVRLAGGAEVTRVLQDIAASRHGNAAIRWRHPTDDGSGPKSSAPLYRIINAGQVEALSLDRSRAGQFGSVELLLERV